MTSEACQRPGLELETQRPYTENCAVETTLPETAHEHTRKIDVAKRHGVFNEKHRRESSTHQALEPRPQIGNSLAASVNVVPRIPFLVEACRLPSSFTKR